MLAGRYRVVRRLGAGGMATVFLATDERLGREVAVKRLHTDAPEASLTRFKREARLGAALNHPNLVAVYDTVVADEGALIVMEYVPGHSLADLTARGAVSPERAVPILRSVAAALDHAHSQDVVHRDVKPANVLVRDDGVVKLADLGIARAVGATQITSEGSVIGTLPYMAPERMRGPGAGGPESDVYALAAVAYEVLSGHPPLETTSTEELAGGAPDLAAGWVGAPRRATAVLERGLDPDPGRRQPTASRLVDELDSSLTGEATAQTFAVAPFEPPPSEPPPPTLVRGQRSSGSGRGGRALAIGAICLAMLAVAGIALAIGGGGDDGSKDQGAAKGEKPAKDAEQQAEPDVAAAPDPAPAEPDGVALNDEGFDLIGAGDYEAAVAVLEQAVAALEGSGDETTYSYALFNLGNALRLAGRPEEAIPILQERLGVGSNLETVQRELEAAFADAGFEFGEGDAPGNGNGNAFGRDKSEDDD